MKKLVLIFVLTSLSCLNLMANKLESENASPVPSTSNVIRIKIKKGIFKAAIKVAPQMAVSTSQF